MSTKLSNIEEHISNLENRKMEIAQTEQQKEKHPAIPLLGIHTEETRIERDTAGNILFCQKFSFHLSFKGFVNKINHSLYTNTQYKYLLENYLTYFQYTNFKRKEK